LDINSEHRASESLQWTSITDSRSALFGIYGLLRSALAQNDGHWIYGDLRLGDFSSTNREDLKSIIQNKIIGSYPLINELESWKKFYAVINAAAVFIEHAPKVVENDPLYSEANLNLDIAQARALRAFAYFYMVRIWGDVPLITQAYDNGTFPPMARTPEKQVLEYATQELKDAIKNLPYLYGADNQTYYDQEASYWNGALFTKISGYALLAHIAAWESKYTDVDLYTQFIMDHYAESNISYSTEDYINNASNGIFAVKAASQIIAFNFMIDMGEATIPGHIEELTLATPFIHKDEPDIYVSKDSIIRIFVDSSDLRFGYDTLQKAYRTAYFSNFSSSIPVFSKIKVVRTGDYPIFGSAIVFTRLEEITLLRAEAMAVLNRSDDAISMLNVVLSERGVPIYSTKTTDVGILDAIFAERRRELMGEGWRWYDQIRYNRIKQVNKQVSSLINNKGIYWPVAKDVIKQNKLITQNPFWN
jgi:hypothetical protein